MKQLSFNPDGQEVAYILLNDLHSERSSIQNLRAVIYQSSEKTVEYINLKKKLVQILKPKEEEKQSNFLVMHNGYKEITD